MPLKTYIHLLSKFYTYELKIENGVKNAPSIPMRPILFCNPNITAPLAIKHSSQNIIIISRPHTLCLYITNLIHVLMCTPFAWQLTVPAAKNKKKMSASRHRSRSKKKKMSNYRKTKTFSVRTLGSRHTNHRQIVLIKQAVCV